MYLGQGIKQLPTNLQNLQINLQDNKLINNLDNIKELA